MTILTTDLCDQHEDAVQVLTPIFRDYGGRRGYGGEVATVRCFEDNSRVREALSEAGSGRILVVDGGGSMRCALLGDNLADLALSNDWSGLLVYGCVRDCDALGLVDIGVKALNTHPRRSVKRGDGERDVAVTMAGVTIRPGNWLYADADGVVLAESRLV